MTQGERIIDYMKRIGPLTALDAVLELGIMEMGKRISELRRDGQPIQSEWCEQKNRFGEDVRFKRYWLDSNPPAAPVRPLPEGPHTADSMAHDEGGPTNSKRDKDNPNQEMMAL
jgi:hypothetical protein